jgi:hypothetical protein
VQNGTASDVFRESVSVEVDSYFDRVPGDERHVVMGDVVMRAVRHADTKRLERFGLNQFVNLFRRDHGWSIKGFSPHFNFVLDFPLSFEHEDENEDESEPACSRRVQERFPGVTASSPPPSPPKEERGAGRRLVAVSRSTRLAAGRAFLLSLAGAMWYATPHGAQIMSNCRFGGLRVAG